MLKMIFCLTIKVEHLVSETNSTPTEIYQETGLNSKDKQNDTLRGDNTEKAPTKSSK